MSQDLRGLSAAAPHSCSYEIERLFTKISQTDLEAMIGWLLDQIWALHGKPLVRVRKDMSPVWRWGNMPAVRTGRDEGASCYTFDLASACRFPD